MARWLQPLLDRGLLAEGVAISKLPAQPTLLKLCDQGVLRHGLSVALDVKPDEAFGALCERVGGRALRLRVLDVRVDPYELRIALDGMEERWDVPDVAALLHNVNDLFQDDAGTRAACLLGEWEDALQVWCVPKAELPFLFEQRFFEPANRADLEKLG